MTFFLKIILIYLNFNNWLKILNIESTNNKIYYNLFKSYCKQFIVSIVYFCYRWDLYLIISLGLKISINNRNSILPNAMLCNPHTYPFVPLFGRSDDFEKIKSLSVYLSSFAKRQNWNTLTRFTGTNSDYQLIDWLILFEFCLILFQFISNTNKSNFSLKYSKLFNLILFTTKHIMFLWQFMKILFYIYFCKPFHWLVTTCAKF
jgi:hypothetical protein